jgi:hypothetical protein
MEKTSRAMNKRDRTDENDAYHLLPPSLEKIIPPLYATENIEEEEKIAYAKFFAPNTVWTWFVLEGEWSTNHEDFMFFGMVHGFEQEYGYFSLSELESVADANPLFRIERDLYFQATPLKNVGG